MENTRSVTLSSPQVSVRTRVLLLLIAAIGFVSLGVIAGAVKADDKPTEGEVQPVACYTPRQAEALIGIEGLERPFILPNGGTRRITIKITAPDLYHPTGCVKERPSSGAVTVTLPSYMSFDSGVADVSVPGTFVGAGQSVTYTHGRMRDNPGYQESTVTFAVNVWLPTSASTAPDDPPKGSIGVNANYVYPTQGNGAVGNSHEVALLYSKMYASTPQTEAVGPGDEVAYSLRTTGYPHFEMTTSVVTITAPTHTEFVQGSITGGGTPTINGSTLTVDLGGASSTQTINFKLRILPTMPPSTWRIIPSYQHRMVMSSSEYLDPIVVFADLITQAIVYVKPTVELEWITPQPTVELNGEMLVKARIKNLSETLTLTSAQLVSWSVRYEGEGLAQVITPLPTAITLAPGQSGEIDYRFRGTRAGKFTITAHAQGMNASNLYQSIPVTTPQLCVGCADAELNIVVDKTQFEVGETFVAYAQVRSNRPEPMTIVFDDPLVDQRSGKGAPKEPMLTIDNMPTPAPFVLTQQQRSRSFPVMVKVDRFGVVDLVSSMTYSRPGQEPIPLESTKAISASPLKVEVDVTPKQTLFDRTPDARKTEACRTLEQLPLVNNCIEFAVRVTNLSKETVTNVNIPNADEPLRLISEMDPRILGEPLMLLQKQFPEGPVTLEAGQEVTWIWRMNAFAAPAYLEFKPTVFGVLSGEEIGAHAKKDFKIVDEALLKWGMRPSLGTSFVSGANVPTDGYIENISADEGGKGNDLKVFVYPITTGNAGGGFVAPSTYNGPTPEKYHIFNLPPKGAGKRVDIKSLFKSFRAEKATSAHIRYEVRVWVVEDDGSISSADDTAMLDEDLLQEFRISYSPEQIPVDGYKAECLEKYRPFICSGFDGLYNEFIPGIVGSYKFAMRGIEYGVERNAHLSMIEASSHLATYESVMGNEEAKNRWIGELYTEYRELHEQQVLFDQVAGQAPMALEQFTLETVDSFGRLMHAVNEGDMLEVEERLGKMLGANADLALEPLILMRGYLKLDRAIKEMAQGTDDNIYAAAERASMQRQKASLDQRIADAKARPGDPDLAKALLPGDVLSAKLLIEVFGVDEETVRRIQKIANEAGVVMAFRARSARASELLRMNLAWPKPQKIKQKTVNKLDIDYLGYREDALGKIEIVEPPSNIRGKRGEELQQALDAHMKLLIEARQELRDNKLLREEVRSRIEIRAKEWNDYTPELRVYDTEVAFVRADVNFEASAQWARDMSGDIGAKESRKIYRNDRGRRTDPATGEEVRSWEIKMDGPNGQEARPITGDIDFLGILDLNGNFINDESKHIAVYKAMVEAQLMEHGESMSLRWDKARQAYLECCVFGSGEGMLTVGPWGAPRAGFFVDNRSVMQEMNTAFKRVRATEVARTPAGEIIYENGRPKEIVIRMEDPSGEFALINGMPTLKHVPEALVRRFRPTLWETVWEHYAQFKINIFFPSYIGDVIRDQGQEPQLQSGMGDAPMFSRVGPIVRAEPTSSIQLQQSVQLQMWTQQNGWVNATNDEVVTAGQPGVVDLAPFSVLREGSLPGANTLSTASQSQMGAEGDFFATGDWIVLDPGGPNQEVARIEDAATMTLQAPLQLHHRVGEMIALISEPAENATVSGRVITVDGRGISRALVTITDPQGASQVVLTNTFGNFRFENLPTGATYTLSVESRRYQFESRSINLGGDLAGIEINPLE